MTRALVCLSTAVALLATSGCASSAKRANALLDDVRGYHDGIRWQRFSQAVLRIPVAERDDFLEERDKLADDLRIGDWEIVRVNFIKKQLRAQVVVKYVWHLDSRGIVHKTTAREVWERRGKRWLVVEEKRTHGEPMPGLAEPDDEESEEGETDEASADESASADPNRARPRATIRAREARRAAAREAPPTAR